MKQTTTYGRILLFVVWAGALFLYSGCGIFADDYLYLHEFIGTVPDGVSFSHCEGALISSIGQVMDSCRLHYLYWGNGRLGSALMFAFNLLPHWLWPVIDASFLTALFYFWLRTINRACLQRPLMALSVAILLWLAIPWQERMLASAYSINYLWSTCLNLWLLCLVEQRLTSLERHSISIRDFIGYMVLALIASIIHEGQSIPMDMWLFLIWLHLLFRLRRTPRPRRKCMRANVIKLSVVALIYALGSMVVIFAPSTVRRGSNIEGLAYFLNVHELLYLFVVQLWPIPLVALTLLWQWLRHGKRRMHLVWHRGGLLIAAAMAGVLTMYYVGSDSLRSHCMNIVLMLIAEYRIIWPVKIPLPERVKKTCAWILLGVYALWLSAIGMIQWQYGEQKHKVEKVLASARGNILFADMDFYDANPWWTMNVPRMPYNSIWFMSMHIMPPDVDAVMVLSSSLRDIDPDKYPDVPGNAGLKGLFPNFFSHKKLPELLVCKFADTPPRPWHKFKGHRLFPYCIGVSERTIPVYFDEIATVGEKVPNYKGNPTDSLYFYGVSYVPRSVHGLTLQRIDTP